MTVIVSNYKRIEIPDGMSFKSISKHTQNMFYIRG